MKLWTIKKFHFFREKTSEVPFLPRKKNPEVPFLFEKNIRKFH
uniref:Uncharacterized protein n=1 Tax=Arundo donax TaxID=35708 RepID=A0A0A9DT32_ARUDO